MLHGATGQLPARLRAPPLDYLIAAIAEDHAILHFERLAAHTDLAATVEALAPLGSLS